ncbi:MAG: hypothetical protein MJZ54_06255 [Bacteroidaceae bacterium]|nr:hypothetical protein [Bacteroidaceae bacterium]
MTYAELNTAIAALEASLNDTTKPLLAQLLMERGEMKRRAHNPDGALADARRAMQLDPSLAQGLNGEAKC